MAMESAAALASKLMLTDAAYVTGAFKAYEQVQKKRVYAAQQSSRNLARIMFCDGEMKANMRDKLIRFYTVKMLVKGIQQLMEP